MNSKKKAGLILSGIGVFLYLLDGSIYLLLLSPTMPVIFSLLLLTGAISLIGTKIGVKKIKMGGAVILLSIPISIVFISALNFFLEYFTYYVPYYTSYNIVLIVLYPIPFPHSVFVIIGGIQCLMSFDE
ncbi:MAG: hypothetical protein KGD68_10915 [Candidatus Lokiarchaeota archaeon]|nr:hypothetical protein [Candidatus Lokiarchaeota archaeon]